MEAASPQAHTENGTAAESGAGRQQSSRVAGEFLGECRVCLLSGQDLISSCDCRGTTQFVHFECLARWVREKGSLVCELCHQSYKEPFRTALEEELLSHGHDPECSRIDIVTHSPGVESPAHGHSNGPRGLNRSCWQQPVTVISVAGTILVGVAVPVWIGLIIGLGR
ncbi:hypothetical protein DUNSADRAFT_7807 [Dunaliella salina]|uniref:RING-CH-type domain-containing protein n=1 Tax=Dunaliella salina TaxID=3046 RepID=A0ABQ7GKX5_DUNSA|nr:hypothetical protein DUNSADRAFT_7807 [Dunaliella salina]|eukprot:KAF5835178.1 hypothetical protein DUNSADRAFT_7807 [Dunaliella salina]